MKKHLILALMALVTFSLYSCGDDDSDPTPDATEVKSNQLALYFATPNVVNLTNIKVCQNYNGAFCDVQMNEGSNNVFLHIDCSAEALGKTINLAAPTSELDRTPFSVSLFRSGDDLEDFIAVECSTGQNILEYIKHETFAPTETCFAKGTMKVNVDDKGYHLTLDGVTKQHSIAGPIICKLKIDVPKSEIILTY